MNLSGTAGGVIAIATVLLTHPSIAADTTIVASPTRAQVRQDAIDARKAGQVRVGEDPYYPYGRNAAVLKAPRAKVQKANGSAADTTASN